MFGRIDRLVESPGAPDEPATESFHIGRLAVADQNSEPVVVDWRAPVAEPFYRATGRQPMGLARRRHFSVEGRKVLGIEDELFGAGHLGVGHDEGLSDDDEDARAARRCAATRRCSPRSSGGAPARSATSSPPSRPSRTRSSAPTSPGCSWCRAGRAPARRSWRCTAPPTSCTPTASRSRTRACWSSAPTACSCATSSGCCPRSARPVSSRSCSPTSSPTSPSRPPPTHAAPRVRRPVGSRATSACPRSSTAPSATASGRCRAT